MDTAGKELHCCGTYRRDAEGVWRYPWGDPVLEATDMTLGDFGSPARTLASRFDAVGIVVGVSAPELEAAALLTVNDISRLASVPVATIQRYWARGELPVAQRARGRKPLWARPIIDHWLASRPIGPAAGLHVVRDDGCATTTGASTSTQSASAPTRECVARRRP